MILKHKVCLCIKHKEKEKIHRKVIRGTHYQTTDGLLKDSLLIFYWSFCLFLIFCLCFTEHTHISTLIIAEEQITSKRGILERPYSHLVSQSSWFLAQLTV